MSPDREAGPPHLDALAQRLEAAFAGGVAQPWGDEAFSQLALEVFRLQLARNETYRRLCESRGATAQSVGHWTEIPLVPARAFKHLDLVCGDPAAVEAVFRTSGTTSDGTRRGRHLVPRLSLYRASLLPTFRAHVLAGSAPRRWISLIPSPEDAPDSSLSRMVGFAARAFADSVAWAVDRQGKVDRAALAGSGGSEAPANAPGGDPVLLLGTAFALVHALDAGVLPRLPDGSRIMETGGFKGRARAVPREELYARLTETTGVPPAAIVNEYGMTELLSQLYEPALADGGPGAGHVAPPWLRVRALDPVTLAPLPEGDEGVLAFFDLANAGSVAHVLTEDLGRIEGGRLFLAGRAEGAKPRGCSRAMDEIMSVAAGP